MAGPAVPIVTNVLARNVSPRLNRQRIPVPIQPWSAILKSDVPGSVAAPIGQPPDPAAAVLLAIQTVLVPAYTTSGSSTVTWMFSTVAVLTEVWRVPLIVVYVR